jgi:hypothetical protein
MVNKSINKSINFNFKTPPANLKFNFLKIDMIRVSLLKEVISKNNYLEALNRSITDKRTIINR